MLYIENRTGRNKPGHPEPKTIFAWYDGRKPQLKEAFQHLTELTSEPQTRLKHSWTRPTAIAAGIAGLAIIQEWLGTGLLLCLLGGLLLCAPWLERRWRLHVYQMAASELTARIKRSQHRGAVLWDDDALWAILAEALKAHGVNNMVGVLGNPTLTNHLALVLAPLLKQTSDVRYQLRTRPDGTAIAYLHAHAKPAAAIIANIYQSTPE